MCINTILGYTFDQLLISVTDPFPFIIISKESLGMIGQGDSKRVKNFKDIKKSIISTRPLQNQNTPATNLEEEPQPSLSFKKITTNRDQESAFTSPSKLLTIDTHPIENVDLSSQKKKQLFLKYKPSNYQAKEPTRPELSRNDSANSNKSQGSHKKALYSQFSQLAEASSKEKKKTVGNNLCFNNLERKMSDGPQVQKRNTLNKVIKPVVGNTVKQNPKPMKEIKPIQSKVQTTLTPKLRKQSSETSPIDYKKQRKSTLVSVKSTHKLINPPTIRQLSRQANTQTPSSSPPPPVKQPSIILTQQFIVERKQSIQTIEDEVRVSVEVTSSMNISLDMSPYI